jgi:hypothetical protein
MDRLVVTEVVAMAHSAAHQVADRGQADVRVRTHVGLAAGVGVHHHRACMIEKHERADRAACLCGQAAQYEQAIPEIVFASTDGGGGHLWFPECFMAEVVDGARSPNPQPCLPKIRAPCWRW